MENQVNQNEQVASVVDSESVADTVLSGAESGAIKYLRVYKKKSTFKGATDTDFWYSATRSDGNSVMCKFKCAIESDSSAFEIYDVVGTLKEKTVVVQGETYKNYTYYITSCKFHEIEGSALPL